MDKILTEARLLEIRNRLLHVSPGPWKSYVEGRDHSSGSSFIMTGTGDTRGPDIELSGVTAGDQDFIASARQDIPDLIVEIQRLQHLLDAIDRTANPEPR